MKNLKTYIVDKDTSDVIWANARWFAGYYFKRTKLPSGKFKVTTNYTWVEA